jgi:hypothetical protein
MYVFWLSPEVGIESKRLKTQAKYSSDYHHHHHWLDSPWWAMAFLRSCAHSSVLRATFFQFLTPNILISLSTPSSHRSFGPPTLLAPSGLVYSSDYIRRKFIYAFIFSHKFYYKSRMGRV